MEAFQGNSYKKAEADQLAPNEKVLLTSAVQPETFWQLGSEVIVDDDVTGFGLKDLWFACFWSHVWCVLDWMNEADFSVFQTLHISQN